MTRTLGPHRIRRSTPWMKSSSSTWIPVVMRRPRLVRIFTPNTRMDSNVPGLGLSSAIPRFREEIYRSGRRRQSSNASTEASSSSCWCVMPPTRGGGKIMLPVKMSMFFIRQGASGLAGSRNPRHSLRPSWSFGLRGFSTKQRFLSCHGRNGSKAFISVFRLGPKAGSGSGLSMLLELLFLCAKQANQLPRLRRNHCPHHSHMRKNAPMMRTFPTHPSP